MQEREFERELEHRLAVIEDPDYRDPARADLPTVDLIAALVGGVLLIVAMLVWGYPW